MNHFPNVWYSDHQAKNVRTSIRIDKQLYSEVSDYQRIDVYESPAFGRFLTLNGDIIFSEADEFVYNEMVVHVPMAVHPDVRNVLIIGGGDGGVARELTAYPEIEHIDVVEADERYVEICREYFPEHARGFSDSRVQIFYQNGLRFLRRRKEEYDLIINDSKDPFGHTEGLFTREFYGCCNKALKEDGLMVYQHGSPFFDEDESSFRSMHRKAYRSFPISRVYGAHIPTCNSGYWMFGFASKKYHPIHDFDPDRWNDRGLNTEYYTTNLHSGAFMLPRYVVDILKQEETSHV